MRITKHHTNQKSNFRSISWTIAMLLLSVLSLPVLTQYDDVCIAIKCIFMSRIIFLFSKNVNGKPATTVIL